MIRQACAAINLPYVYSYIITRFSRKLLELYQLEFKICIYAYNFTKSIVLVVVIVSIVTNTHAHQLTLYDQLVTVKNEWENQQEIDPALKSKHASPLIGSAASKFIGNKKPGYPCPGFLLLNIYVINSLHIPQLH
jgi:hypothetical protein